MKLALKITPQRSTQYANMVETLAAPELLASPVGASIKELVSVTLAGQQYLLATVNEERVEQLSEIVPCAESSSLGRKNDNPHQLI